MIVGRWAFLLGGLIVWAAHFFLVYGFSLIFPGTQLARLLTLIATVPALAADAALMWVAAAGALRGSSDDLDIWVRNLGAVGALLSAVAVLWQALPALMV